MYSVQPGGELRDQAVGPSPGLLTMPSHLPFLNESVPSILVDGLLRASDFLQVGTGKLTGQERPPEAGAISLSPLSKYVRHLGVALQHRAKCPVAPHL